MPGLVLAGQYGLTGLEPRHRGDTLGAHALPGGRVGLMVADVVGHGIGASFAAVEARAILWSFLCDGASLLEALEGVDRQAERHPELVATAVGVVVLDPQDGTLEYAAAGLLPPLVLSARGEPFLLDAKPMRPLGTGGVMHVHRGRLRSEEMLVLSTNGLVNTPAHCLDEASRALATCAAQALDESAGRGSSLHQRADDVAHSMLSQRFTTLVCDDVAVLAAQRVPLPSALTLQLDADSLDLVELRSSISGWLDGLGAGLADHISLGHALVELATNVVNHAYRSSDREVGRTGGRDARPIRIDAALDAAGDVVATVSDRGEWRAPGAGAGRGLSMTSQLVDSLLVHRSSRGTDVEIRARLGRPVHLWEAEPDASVVQPVPLPDELLADVVTGRLTASGPVDEASADLFHAALIEATHAGTIASTVDLTDVTHLASPGVQSLFDLAGRSSRSGVRMDIVAPTSSPARQILDLVGLAASP